VNAIYAEDDVPSEMEAFIALNIELAKKWPVITQRKAAPDDAKDWENVGDKLKYLER